MSNPHQPDDDLALQAPGADSNETLKPGSKPTSGAPDQFATFVHRPADTVAGKPPAQMKHEPAGPAPATPPADTATPTLVANPALTIAAAPTDPNATIRPDPNATMATGAKPAAVPKAARKMFGEYEILDTIARGGMGIVYKARQRKLNRVVALKMILAGQFADQADVDRFYIEAEASANLRHPNIVGIHEVGECEGQHYFSMDYIEGTSLADLVREHALPPRRAAEYVKTISDAMHYAHQHGILHRDLKPSNVLLDSENTPFVTDFGLAKRTEGQSQLTMSGTIVGTPAYMPPEQASGKLELVSVRSDVYSLGAILFELLTGRPPFVSANPFETIKQVLESEPVAPRLLNPNIPVDLETICLKCLRKEAERRYATAHELVEELQRYLAGEPILARPVGMTERFWRWCRRNPRVAASLGVTAATLLFAAIVFPILYVRAEAAHLQSEQALAKAEASLDQMRIAIDELYRIVAEEDLLNEPGFKPVRQKLLIRARDLYREVLDRLGDNPKVQEDMAVSMFSLGRILRELEEPNEALEPLSKARGIQEELLAAQPDNTIRIRNLGNTINLIGQVYENQRKLTDALEVYERAIQLRQDLVRRDPQNHEYGRQLENSQMNSGLIHERIFRQGDAAHYQLALERLRESQTNRNELLRVTPNDAKLHLDAAMVSYNLAKLTFLPLDDLRNEIQPLQDELNALQELASLTPEQQSHSEALNQQLVDLRARANPLQSQTNEYLQMAFAELALLQAPDAKERLNGYRQIDQFQIRQLQAYCLLQEAYVIEDTDVAAQRLEQALQIVEGLVRENQESHEFLGMLGGVYMMSGDMHYNRFEDQAAVTAYGRAIGVFQQLIQKFPGVVQYESQRKTAEERLAEIQSAMQAQPAATPESSETPKESQNPSTE